MSTRIIILNLSDQQIKDAVALCELFAWLEKEVFLILDYCSCIQVNNQEHNKTQNALFISETKLGRTVCKNS